MYYKRSKKGVISCYNTTRLEKSIHDGLVTMQKTNFYTKNRKNLIYTYGITKNGVFYPSFYRSEYWQVFYQKLIACMNSDDPRITSNYGK